VLEVFLETNSVAVAAISDRRKSFQETTARCKIASFLTAITHLLCVEVFVVKDRFSGSVPFFVSTSVSGVGTGEWLRRFLSSLVGIGNLLVGVVGGFGLDASLMACF